MAEDGSPAPARVRNRRGEGARLREEIVAAAADLLDESGDTSAITLRSVARRVGIAAPSIYRHFPDQPAIVLAVVRNAFADLDQRLRADTDAAGDAPRARLLALCDSYLTYARERPGRYRTMFGGVWLPDLNEVSVTEEDVATLGQSSMVLVARALDDCVAAGCSTSTDSSADAVALWIGLHGLADQRAAAPSFRWPADIAERVVTALARLVDE